MTLNFSATIRKMMGWCPQKGFNLADARREKHELYDDKFFQKDSHAAKSITTGDKLIIEYPDINMASIVIITGILFLFVMGIFFIIAFFIPILRNFYHIIFSIAFFIISFLMLNYSYKSNAELTSGSIIINRPFHKSVVILKDSILKTEVVKNYNHSFRWIFPLMVIMCLALFMYEIIDVSSHYFSGNYSLLDTISIVFMKIGIMSVYISIYFMGKKTSPYRSALKITAKLKNEVSLYVYVDDPQEIKNALEVNI